MNNPRKNPNSSIRKGYRFEDLHVLRLCIDWLKKPTGFTSIRVQFVPDEFKGRRFSIDDIVTEHDQHKTYYQVKHIQNPETDLWTFDKLVEKGLLKWIRSFNGINQTSNAGCFLITNGHADNNLCACLQDTTFSFDAIQTAFPDQFAVLENEFTVEELSAFFKSFQFIFSMPEQGDYFEQLRTELNYDLKVTGDGVNRLLLYIESMAMDVFPDPLSLQGIRDQLSWDDPRPLNQNFTIPDDFEYFDKARHNTLLKDISGPEGGIRVIIGKPGAGKSTYLSNLYKTLTKQKIPAARHHYHLNPKDSSFRDRLNSDRVVEALRAEFKKQKQEVLGDLSHQNTEHIHLREFLSRIAAYYAARQQSFILIIDGLDHVIREGKNEQHLKDFLNEILYPQPGLFILFGTQEMAIHAFPNVIYQYHPREQWIEIKGLNRNAVTHLVLQNATGLELPEHKELLNEFADAVYQKTTGNPLHLRYVLAELKNLSGQIHANDLDHVLPYKNEIADYYEDLWRQLSDISRTICFAIASLDYKLHEEELMSLAATFTQHPADIPDSYRKIKHLVRVELSGISPYHNSFNVFLLKQQELVWQRDTLFKAILNWVKKSDNEDLKWYEEAKLEFLLGNPDPILAMDKNWVIKSYLDCRDEEHIEKILSLAADAGYAKKDIEKGIYFHELERYFANRQGHLHDTLAKIWVTSFSMKKRARIPYPDFGKFNHYQLREILLALHDRGLVHEIPPEAADRFNDLFRENQFESNEIYESWLRLKAGFDSTKLKNVYKNLVENRSEKNTGFYFGYFVNALLKRKKIESVTQFLQFDFRSGEKKTIAYNLVEDDLFHNSEQWKEQIIKLAGNPSPGMIQFYLALRKHPVRIPAFTRSTEFIKAVQDSRSINTSVPTLYQRNFYIALLQQHSPNKSKVTDWIKTIPKDWPGQLMQVIINAANELVACITEKKRCKLKTLLFLFDSLPNIPYNDDRDIFEIRRTVVPGIMQEIFRLHTYINVFNGFESFIEVEDCEKILTSIWIFPSDLSNHFMDKDVTLSDEAFAFYRTSEVNRLNTELMHFRDRADKLINLAILAKGLNKSEEANGLLQQSAQFIISYNYHKDMQLDRILRAVDICGAAGSAKMPGYLRDIAKYVYNIEKLTDGEETGSFIYDYGDLLAKYAPSLLYNLYLENIKKRDYGLSSSLFGDIIDTLDLNDPVSYAVAGTAVDQSSYISLQHRAKTDAAAANVFMDIQNTLGKIDYTHKDRGNDHNYPDRPDTTDYASVEPDTLKSYLENEARDDYFSRRYGHQKYLEGWSKYWLTKEGSDTAKILSKLKPVIEPEFKEMGHQLPDFLYPYALPHDPELAFQCLVWAHASNSSWGDEYICRMETSRNRWLLAIKDFPDRIDEFFEQSTFRTGLQYGSEGGYFIAIPKSIQFFVDAARLSTAERVTEAYINDLSWLFPGEPLKTPEFIANERKIEPIELLITRFESISPLVRERAGWHLAALLEKDKNGALHKFFFEWLSQKKLESFVCNGLLVLIKSLKNSASQSHSHINATKLANGLNIYSRAIQLLFTNISQTLNQSLRNDIENYLVITTGHTRITKEQFIDTLGRYLTMAYVDYLERMEDEVQLPLWEIWHSLYKSTCEELELTEEWEDKNYGNRSHDVMIGRSTIFSEILKSTFSNLIEYLFETKAINYTDFFHHTLRNFSVDPSFWHVPIGEKPTWWPRLNASPPNKEVQDPSPWLTVNEKILTIDHGKVLLQMRGAASAFDMNYEDEVDAEVSILPFAYAGTTSNLPVAEKLYKKLNPATICYPYVTTPYRFETFTNEFAFSEQNSTFSFGNCTVFTLVSALQSSIPHIWQYYRWMYGCMLLNPVIADTLKLHCDAGGIRYTKGESEVAWVIDFTDGIRDHSSHGRLPPAGRFLLVDRDLITSFLSTHAMKLGYISRKIIFLRDSNHSEKPKEHIYYEYIFPTTS